MPIYVPVTPREEAYESAREPHAGARPGRQAAPAAHPAAAAQLLRQGRPLHPGLQHQHDPRQAGPVGHPRAARLPRVLRPVGRHQRRHHRPPRVAHQRLGQTLGRARSGPSLLGAHAKTGAIRPRAGCRRRDGPRLRARDTTCGRSRPSHRSASKSAPGAGDGHLPGSTASTASC